jgi:hypothetical protein
MKSGRKKFIGFICANAIALVCGLGGYASRVDAQTGETRAAGRSRIGGPSTLRAADAENRHCTRIRILMTNI